MKTKMIWIVTIPVLIYLIIALGLYSFQRNLMYLPDRQILPVAETGLSGVEQVTLKTADGEQLLAWYSPAKPSQPTLLFFHGNAGSIADRADRLAFYRQQGFGALFVSYRGYATSTGSPTQKGLINDALASYDWLANPDVILVGESLGAAVAAQLAIRRPVRALIMEAPFTSTVNVARTTYWWLPLDLLVKDKFNTIEIIDQTKVPLMIIHGQNDEITSAAQGRQLFAKANEPKTLHVIKDGTHMGIMDETSWSLETAFINSLALK